MEAEEGRRIRSSRSVTRSRVAGERKKKGREERGREEKEKREERKRRWEWREWRGRKISAPQSQEDVKHHPREPPLHLRIAQRKAQSSVTPSTPVPLVQMQS